MMRHSGGRGLVATLALALLLAAPGFALDWPQWRGPNRDNKSKETGLMKVWPADGPKEVWSYDKLGMGFSSVSVANGTVYITGAEGSPNDNMAYLYAFDEKSGDLKWKTPYAQEPPGKNFFGTRTTPTIDDGRAYIYNGAGILVCFDAKTGKEIYKIDTLKRFEGKKPIWDCAESILIDGDNLICTPGGPNAIVALKKADGATVWTSKGLDEPSGYCSPVIVKHGGADLLLTMTATNAVGLNPATGELYWKHHHQNQWKVMAVTPVYANDTVFITSGYEQTGEGLALSPDGKSVTPKYKSKTLASKHHGVIELDGYVYGAGTNSGVATCLEIKTGKELWKSPKIGAASTLLVDGMLYMYTERGDVVLAKANTESYQPVSSFKVTRGEKAHWAHPVVANGRLYVRHGTVLMVHDIKGQ